MKHDANNRENAKRNTALFLYDIPFEITLWAVGIILLFWVLGNRGLWASEGRWAEVTREMFLSNNFFHPTINAQPYFDKPLLTYWIVAAASFLTGGLNEWSARLPSALFALFAVWATRRMGRRLWSREVGDMAAWMLLVSFGLVFWGRTAAAETENLAAIILAVLWYFERRDRLNFLTYLIFYLICFTGAHFKGLTAVVVPVLAIFPDLIREGRWRSLLRFPHFVAIAIGIALYLCPFLYADLTRGTYGESGLGMMVRENIIRYFKPFDHKGPVYLYVYYLPLLVLPWSPIIIMATIWSVRSYRQLDTLTKWLLEAATLIFVFFTASGSRRGYYILPILPFCALLGAVFLDRCDKPVWKRVIYFSQSAVLAFPLIVFIASPVIWPYLERHIGFIPPSGLKTATFVLGVTGLVGWLWLMRFRSYRLARVGIPSQLVPLLFASVVLVGGYFCWQQPTLEEYRTGKKFALELRREVSGLRLSQIAFFHSPSANILFYLDLAGPVRVLQNSREVAQFLSDTKRPKVLIARRKYLPRFFPLVQKQLDEATEYSEKLYPWMRKKCRYYIAWKFPPHSETSRKTGDIFSGTRDTRDCNRLRRLFPDSNPQAGNRSDNSERRVVLKDGTAIQGVRGSFHSPRTVALFAGGKPIS